MDSRQARVPSPLTFGVPSPGAAAQGLPARPPRLPSAAWRFRWSLGHPRSLGHPQHLLWFCEPALTGRAQRSMDSFLVGPERLLCFRDQDPAHVAGHCCGNPCRGPPPANAQRPCVKEGSENVVAQIGPRDGPHLLVVTAWVTLLIGLGGSGAQGPGSPWVLVTRPTPRTTWTCSGAPWPRHPS